MMQGILQSKHRWFAAALLGALMGALAWPLAAPRVVSRVISMTVVQRGEGPLALRWSSSNGSNGMWIDLDDPVLRATHQEDGSRRWAFVQRLPSYEVARLSVEPSEGASVEVSDALVKTRVLGIAVPSRVMSVAHRDGTALLEPLPGVGRHLLVRGIASLAAIGAIAGVFLLGLALGLLRLEARRLEKSVVEEPGGNLDGRKRRVLDLATIALCIGAPLLMCLWSPMLIIADSTAYIWLADALRESGSLARFDGWRMPGYALFLAPFVALFSDYAIPVGIAQAAMGVITSLLVFDMLRGSVRRPWAHVAASLVAIDPVLLGWQRVVMGESLSALAIAFAAWLFLRIVKSRQTSRNEHGAARGAVLGLVLGIACGCACLIRGNNQVVPAVLIAGLAWCGILWRRRGALAAIVPTFVVTAAMMLPLCVLNAKNHGAFTPTVGRHFTRALFSWENETTDWNQCGTLSFEEFKQLRGMLRERAMTDWDVLEWLAETRTVRAPEGTSPWLARELRSKALVDEAVARDGPTVLKRQVQAGAGLLGIPVTEPAYALSGTWAIFTQLRGETNPRTTTNFDFSMDKFPARVQEVIGRSVRDISWTQSHPAARAFGWWFDSWRWVRALLGLLFLCALARLVVTRRWAFAVLGLVVMANIVGVPALTYAAEYRYAAPYYPLVAVVIALGLFLGPSRACAPVQNQGNPDL